MPYILRYILNDKKGNTKRTPPTLDNPSFFLIKHNLRSTTLKGIIEEFNRNERFRISKRMNNSKANHTILSFAAKDHDVITDEILKDIAQKFIEERGTDILYLGTVHRESHIHLHICSSPTRINGKSARLSNEQFRSIKVNLEKYQREKYPFLEHSEIDHFSSTKKERILRIDELKRSRQSRKALLFEEIQNIYNRSTSELDFLNRIKATGYDSYTRNGNTQGIVVNGVKYRLRSLGIHQEQLSELHARADLTQLQTIRQKRKDIAQHLSNEYDLTASVRKNDQLKEIQDIRMEAAEQGIEREMVTSSVVPFDPNPFDLTDPFTKFLQLRMPENA